MSPEGTPATKSMMSVRSWAENNDFSESFGWKLVRLRRVRAVKVGRSTRITAEADAEFRRGLPAIGEAA